MRQAHEAYLANEPFNSPMDKVCTLARAEPRRQGVEASAPLRDTVGRLLGSFCQVSGHVLLNAHYCH